MKVSVDKLPASIFDDVKFGIHWRNPTDKRIPLYITVYLPRVKYIIEVHRGKGGQ